MTPGKRNRNLSGLGFTDLLFNTLIGFVFLFVIAFLLIAPPVPTDKKIDPKAEILIILTWPEGSSKDIDMWATLWHLDQTKISFGILILFYGLTAHLGHQSYKLYKSRPLNFRTIEVSWFFAESMITLGLIGTVTGFIIMLGGAFADLDLSNIGQAKEVIRDMAAGMSTALTTTLVGLVCSIITKLQLMNLEYDSRKA